MGVSMLAGQRVQSWETSEMSHYIHAVPGRLRVKNPILKYNSRKCTIARDTLAGLPGVNEVKVNPSTGSVTVWYDKETTRAERLLDILEERRLVCKDSLSAGVAADPFVGNVASEAGEKVAKALLGWAVGRALEANGLSLLAAFI